jgi:rhodanese-related sulfurtransferase
MMDVTPQRLKEELDKGTSFLIVDLQETEKYQHAHIPGAVNISMETFREQYPAVLKDKAMSIVVYGEYDELHKGSDAAAMLEEAGYTRVGHVVGGLHGWQEAGYIVEGGWES